MYSKHLAVTGITGHTGGFFLDSLENAKYNGSIRALVRAGSDLARIDASPLSIERVVVQLDNESSLLGALEGCDTLVHIANIGFSEMVVKAAVKCGVRWCILVHTTGCFSRFKGASAGYNMIEENLRPMRGRIAITILRPTMIYGTSSDKNMFKLIDYLYRHRLFPVFGDGRNLMQPVHARDLGRAYFLVLANEQVTSNREYNLSGGDALSYAEIIQIISAKLGRKRILIRVPIGLSITLARVYIFLVKKAKISVEQVMRMQEDKAFGHEEARRDFGYDPVRFSQGISGEIEEYLALNKRAQET